MKSGTVYFSKRPADRGSSVAEGTASLFEAYWPSRPFAAPKSMDHAIDKGDAASVNPNRTSHLPGCVSEGGSAGRRNPSSVRWCTADQGRAVRERSWASAATPVQSDTITAPAGADGPDAAGPGDNPARDDDTATTPAGQGRPPLGPVKVKRPTGPVGRSEDLATAVRDRLARVIAQVHRARARVRSAHAAVRSTQAGVRSAEAGVRLAGAWIRLACTQLKPERDERLTDWIARCIRQLGDLVFAREDQEATWHAWDVERRDAGLGRRYRDRRFQALVPCPRCHRVSTVADGADCPQCSAADRLIHA